MAEQSVPRRSDTFRRDLEAAGFEVHGGPGQARTEDGLRLVAVMLCEGCIAGEGGECHAPGCALWMNRAPDVPLTTVCDLKVDGIIADLIPLARRSDDPGEVGRDTRHMRLSDPAFWSRMTEGERLAYDNGWLQATLNILAPSHRAASDEGHQ